MKSNTFLQSCPTAIWREYRSSNSSSRSIDAEDAVRFRTLAKSRFQHQFSKMDVNASNAKDIISKSINIFDSEFTCEFGSEHIDFLISRGNSVVDVIFLELKTALRQEAIDKGIFINFILDKLGFAVRSIKVGLLNPNGKNPSEYLYSMDISEDVKSQRKAHFHQVYLRKLAKSLGPMPKKVVSKDCNKCSFRNTCWSEDKVLLSEIPKLTEERLALLKDCGVNYVNDIFDVNDVNSALTERQQNFVNVIVNKRSIIDSERMKVDLNKVGFQAANKTASLQLNSISRALPVEAGIKPYQAMITGFNLYHIDKDGNEDFIEYSGSENDVAHKLLEVLERAEISQLVVFKNFLFKLMIDRLKSSNKLLGLSKYFNNVIELDRILRYGISDFRSYASPTLSSYGEVLKIDTQIPDDFNSLHVFKVLERI